MPSIKWEKKGLIYNVDGALPWAQSHAQIPTVDIIDERTLRIYYSSRDAGNLSRTGYIDVESSRPNEVTHVGKSPILELGTPGSFDDCGIMPSWVVTHNGLKYLYYIGWNVRNTVPYHNSIGLAVSDDNGDTFRKLYDGPIMDRTASEPFFCATSCIHVENGIWRNWYLSCTEWVTVQGKLEPRYNLKYAESSDGINWTRDGTVAIDYANDEEGGIVRASVIKQSHGYLMWYSYRSHHDYRSNSQLSYRIGFAHSLDGIKWTRQDQSVGIDVSRDGWDSFMVAYPHVVNIGGQLHMFYNGNGFGKTGLGYATLTQ